MLCSWIWLVYGGRNGSRSPSLSTRRATLQVRPRLFGQSLSETASTSDSPGPNRRGSIAKKRRGCEERSEARPSCKSIPSAFLRLSSRASSSRLEPSKLSCNTDQLGGG